jgi:two-component system, OmpR family, response regulator
MPTTTLESKKTKKALIIEDEADMCLLLNIMLNDDDVDLDHVKSISAAKEYLKNEQPSVILLDNKLPDGYGVDFISFIKSHYPNAKIIMISGYDASVEDVALDSGADVFLQKPFTKDQLYKSMVKLLN